MKSLECHTCGRPGQRAQLRLEAERNGLVVVAGVTLCGRGECQTKVLEQLRREEGLVPAHKCGLR